MGRLDDVTLGRRARLGILYPESGLLDEEFWMLAPSGTAVFLTRTHQSGPASVPVLTEMANAEDLARSAEAFAGIGVNAIAYACTAAGFIRGPGTDAELVDRLTAGGKVPATCTITASVRALRTLGVRRIAVATPYVGEIDALLAAFLRAAGFEIVKQRALGLRGTAISLVPLDEVRDLVLSIDDPSAEAVYIACTGLRTVGLIGDLEGSLGKPVVSANIATMWELLHLAGVEPEDWEGTLGQTAPGGVPVAT